MFRSSWLGWFSAGLIASLAGACASLARTETATGVGGSSVGSVGSAGAGGEGGSFASSTASASSSGGMSSGGAPLGGACETNSDCEKALVCDRETDNDPIFGGGPAGGLCTSLCMADADCGSAGLCLTTTAGPPGRCVPSCTIGPPLMYLEDPLDPAKCLGRADLRCAKTKAGEACVPTCGDDAQCTGGRVCDPRLTVCVDVASAGAPIGEVCDPNVDPPACAGVCIGFSSGDAMCSTPCVLGGDALSTSDCGGPEHGLCAFRPSANGAGDFGFCTPSCAAHLDCQKPSFWCFGIEGVTEVVQRGFCFGATPCPGGQGECVDANQQPTGYTCTDTPQGAFCLDTSFPYDGAGADAGPP